MSQIAGDKDSAEWTSSPPVSRGKLKAPWLAETLAKLDKKKKSQAAAEKSASDLKKKRKVSL